MTDHNLKTKQELIEALTEAEEKVEAGEAAKAALQQIVQNQTQQLRAQAGRIETMIDIVGRLAR